jgi:hypothetical protein
MSRGQIVRIALLVAGAAIAWFGWGVNRDGKGGESLDAYREVTGPIATIHAEELRLKKKGSVEFDVPRSRAWMEWGGGESGRQFLIQGLDSPQAVRVRKNGSEIATEASNGIPAFHAKPGDRISLEVEAAGNPAVASDVVVMVPWDYGYAEAALLSDWFMSIVGGFLMFFGGLLALITLAVWVVIARRKRNVISTPT